MLINLSNHPSSKWSDKQKGLAEFLFGEIVDMQFPNIDPHANEEEVQLLADKYFGELLTIINNPDDVVHIMGEQTFCYYLINKLRDFGIKCLASTTERIVEERDGQKISRFEFARFRYYF